MTRSQELELQRMTEVMWIILYRAEGSEGVEPGDSSAAIWQRHLTSARNLESRGFLRLRKLDVGWYHSELTKAGYEALDRPMTAKKRCAYDAVWNSAGGR
jgi:hypothetical protein